MLGTIYAKHINFKTTLHTQKHILVKIEKELS